MRSQPWRLLTARGWTFLAFGVVTIIAALAYGQADVLWVGLLLILLPVAAVVVVGRSRLHLSCERTVDPPRTILGDRMNATLHLVKSGSLPTGLLRFEDTVPRELGRRPRFTIHRFAGEWRREISYPLIGLARGRYRTGPLLVRASDPFGLAQIDRRFRATREVMVTPEVVPLGAMSAAGGAGQSGESTPQRIGVTGSDDVLVREYRMGDDMRRVHWRSTAKKGELMVRREEQAWDPAVTILLDSRASAHAGQGRTSSFEWCVSAATSIALHLISSGFRVDIVDAAGPVLDTRVQDPAASREIVTIAMTDQQISEGIGELDLAGDACTRAKSGELLIAITGRLTTADVQALVMARSHRSRAMVIVVDADTFTSRRFRGTIEQADQHEESIELLRDHNFRVTPVRQGVSVSDAWRDLDRIGAAL